MVTRTQSGVPGGHRIHHTYTTHTPHIHHAYATHTPRIRHAYATHTPRIHSTHTFQDTPIHYADGSRLRYHAPCGNRYAPPLYIYVCLPIYLSSHSAMFQKKVHACSIACSCSTLSSLQFFRSLREWRELPLQDTWHPTAILQGCKQANIES